MSENINNSGFRKQRLKELILKLHRGESAAEVRQELADTLKSIPYGEVVEVEQELIHEGLPESEVLRLCDIHGEVLEGQVDLSGAKPVPAGHPVDVFTKENAALKKVADKTMQLLGVIQAVSGSDFRDMVLALTGCFNELMDVDKHYQRKEYLLFPFLEKRDITGPPKVMWGKHDEIRDQLKGCIEVLRTPGLEKEDLLATLDLLFIPAVKGVADMITKEEEILFPMSMDMLTAADWWQIHRQTPDFGFTLVEPEADWQPEGMTEATEEAGLVADGSVRLPTGKFTAEELMAILNTLPVDMTFVDRNDKVKYFSQGKERIFARSRSIINRDVRLCHPPGSTHIVEKILEDFKSGKASHAPFWIQMQGKFILIEYFALRNDRGEYLGTLEVSQDLTHNRALSGERRILSYTDPMEEN
ncbi:MAG TPA: DUF438 domain-containing protein [Bacteroidales bacterium]|nr:DUF438 domain-containing protein [Bacteroidales bacterium]HRZ50281.1 DUF438 domain-containing protein [Bacteroidales bacterium]